jgi:hypothetical protein
LTFPPEQKVKGPDDVNDASGLMINNNVTAVDTSVQPAEFVILTE